MAASHAGGTLRLNGQRRSPVPVTATGSGRTPAITRCTPARTRARSLSEAIAANRIMTDLETLPAVGLPTIRLAGMSQAMRRSHARSAFWNRASDCALMSRFGQPEGMPRAIDPIVDRDQGSRDGA